MPVTFALFKIAPDDIIENMQLFPCLTYYQFSY